MGILDKFVTFEKDKKNGAAAPSVSTVTISQPSAPVPMVDPAKYTTQLLEARKKSGAGANSFTAVLQSLASAPLTEDQKYQTALNAWKAAGGSIQQLQLNLDTEMRIIETEFDKFTQALNDAKSKNAALLTEAEKLKSDNSALQQQIINNNARMQQCLAENQTRAATLQSSEVGFNTAYTAMKNDISQFKAKLTSYAGV